MEIRFFTVKRAQIALVILSAILLVYVSGPILEEFGIALAAKAWNFGRFFPTFASRPLGFFFQFVAGRISGINPLGYALLNLLFLGFRLRIVYGLRDRLGKNMFLASILLIFFPPWFAIFDGRYSASLDAITISLLAWYFYLKNGRLTWRVSILSCVPALVYPVLIIVIPFAWLFSHAMDADFHLGSIKKLKLDAIQLIATTFIYLVSYEAINRVWPEAYDSQFSLKGNFFNSFTHLYYVFFYRYWIQNLLALSLLIAANYFAHSSIKRILIGSTLVWLALPLSASMYLQSIGHLNDPDRIFCPYTACLMMVLITTLSKVSVTPRKIEIGVNTALAVVLGIWIGSVSNYWVTVVTLDRQVVSGVSKIVALHPEYKEILVEDKTGKLGDVNTLYEGSLANAVAYSHPNVKNLTLCSLSTSVGRYPVAARFPIPGPPQCSASLIKAGELVIVVEHLLPFKATLN